MYRWVQQVLVLAVAIVDVVDDRNDAEPVLTVVVPGSMKQENTIQNTVPHGEKNQRTTAQRQTRWNNRNSSSVGHVGLAV